MRKIVQLAFPKGTKRKNLPSPSTPSLSPVLTISLQRLSTMTVSTKSAFPLLLAATCVLANCPPPSEHRLPVPSITAVELSTLQHNLTVELDRYLTSASSSDPSFADLSLSATITYSREDSAIEYNHGPRGSNVTAEHVFRIGSVSKVFAVYEALLHGLDFDSRVAEYIPEFGVAELEEITLGSLAGQISGLTRDCAVFPPLLPSHPLPWRVVLPLPLPLKMWLTEDLVQIRSTTSPSWDPSMMWLDRSGRLSRCQKAKHHHALYPVWHRQEVDVLARQRVGRLPP